MDLNALQMTKINRKRTKKDPAMKTESTIIMIIMKLYTESAVF